MDTNLKKQLLDLQEKDQKVSSLTDKEMANTYESNANQLKEIVKKHGWPKRSQVDNEGVEAAWLIAQHADHDINFQEECLKLIKIAISENEAPKHHFAYLQDRVLINRGKPQIFGTQFYKNDSGEMVPKKIENEKNLDKKRLEYGLPPIDQYKIILNNLNKGNR